MAWVKISIPTGTELASNMTILGNRKTLDWNQPHAWRFYFNINTGNIEFSARGASSLIPIKLVERPYLDRWYHLAIVRSNTTYTPYVDGRALTPYSQDIGNASTTDGVSIGGFKGGEKFWGEIQEVAIFHAAHSALLINTNRLRDIPTNTPGLRGYYKLAYSTTPADNTKNFATVAPTGTENATKVGTGTIDYPETDKQGEQSLFDSQKNNGRDALAPLAGAFSWQRTILSRSTAGIPFEFRVGYNSGISFNSQALEGGSNMFEEDSVLGPGWRHSFQTRLIRGSKFLVGGSGFIGLLLWDGSLETWRKPSGLPYTPLHGEYRGELIVDPLDSDYMLWITPDRLIYRFYHPSETADGLLAGKLAEIRDFNGNRVILTYEPDAGLLDKVTDTAGTVWQFNYEAGLLKTVTALNWTATFTYDAQNKLKDFSHRGPAAYEATPVLPTTWSFAYAQPGGANSPHAVNLVTNPLNFADITIAYDKYGRKISETDGGNRATTYQYLTPGPRQITRTDGDQFKWIDTFDRKGHVIAKADPLGNTTRFEYYALGDPMPALGSSATCPVAGVLKKQTEPLGFVTNFDIYDDRANLLQKTDALGHVWKWTFAKTSDPFGANGKLNDGNPSTPLISLLNRPLTDTRPRVVGETTDWQNRYIYDSRGNLLRHEDDIGTMAEYTYDSRGLVETAKDGNFTLSNPSVSSTSYDPITGFRLSSTDPYNKTTHYQPTELGWVKSSTNPIGETTTNEFDINGRVIRTTNQAGHTVSTVIDAIGRQRFVTDAKLQTSESRYNNSNLREWIKDRAGNITDITYNQRSLPTHTYSPSVPISQTSGPPLSQRLTSLQTYDSAGRPLRETDPANDYIEHTYDLNGNEITTRDKLGKLHRKQYDALNRVAVEIDPLGNTRSTVFDEAGRVLAITNPKGSVTRHTYDGRSRLKEWTDPEGHVWIYTYDGVGNITNIRDALGGNYRMTYDLRSARLTEKNQDDLEWIYTYDDLGRLKTQTEPTGVTHTVTYDPAGRAFLVQFSTGRQNVISYDNNNNVWAAIRIDAGTQQATFTTFDYDSLDRPISSTDIFGKKVEYGYDALGRLTSLTYPGGKVLSQEFDNRNRLVRQTTPANWGSHTLTYAWDKQGRLTGQTYPNGMLRAASYDDAGRQETLSYTDGKGTADTADDAVQIALSYGYDRNGNQTSAKEKGLSAYTPPGAHDEISDYTAGGRLVTRTDDGDPSGAKNWTYEFRNTDNTPSFNLSKATNPSIGSLALTYDEDNRTTQLQVTPPTGSPSTITNRYDASGRRISRTLSTPGNPASETRYILNLIGGMERILADTNASGAISSYYLHGPDLAVKIDATDPTQITCFHADASGNVVRLTDKTRDPVAQYAYSDYGRPLAVTAAVSPDTNPYRFVGSQGVMEEPILPGLYFMRARYYLADAGVFLSVDPVKNIGPGWKPERYGYANGNPITLIDPQGTTASASFLHTAHQILSFGDEITDLLATQRAAIQNDIGPNEWLYKTSSVSASLLEGGPVLEGITSGLTSGVGVVSDDPLGYLADEVKDRLLPGRHIVPNLRYLFTGENLPSSLRAPSLVRQDGGAWLDLANSIDRSINSVSTRFSGNQFSTNGGSFANSTPMTISSNSTFGSSSGGSGLPTTSRISGGSTAVSSSNLTGSLKYSDAFNTAQNTAAVNMGNALSNSQYQTALSGGALMAMGGSSKPSTASSTTSSSSSSGGFFSAVASFFGFGKK
jgi:RHS repeat-associated protein